MNICYLSDEDGIPVRQSTGHMAEETERVTVRLSAATVKGIKALMKTGDYQTVSDVIRIAIEEFLERKFSPENISKFMIALPKGNVDDLQGLVKGGDSVSMDDAIRNAVREYIRLRVASMMKDSQDKDGSKETK